MKRTIAYKKRGAGITYIVFTVVFLAAFILGIFFENPKLMILLGIIPMIICAVLSINYLSLPSDLIVLSDDGDSIIFTDDEVIPLSSIRDVSYRRASSRGTQYRWGSVTVKTDYDEYMVSFVADCEKVSKELTRLVYEAERESNREEATQKQEH